MFLLICIIFQTFSEFSFIFYRVLQSNIPSDLQISRRLSMLHHGCQRRRLLDGISMLSALRALIAKACQIKGTAFPYERSKVIDLPTSRVTVKVYCSSDVLYGVIFSSRIEISVYSEKLLQNSFFYTLQNCSIKLQQFLE